MNLRQTTPAHSSPLPALALLLLSSLWALASLLPDLVPQVRANSPSPALTQAALFTVFAAIASSVTLARHAAFPRGRRAWACALVGIGLFVVPSLLAMVTQDFVSSVDRVAAFALTPIFAVVLEPHLQDGSCPQGKFAFPAALTAFAGFLCIFPLDIPGSLAAGAALCALIAAAAGVAAANCLAVNLARTLSQHSILPMAAVAAAASAICFAAVAAFTPHSALHWNLPASRLPGLLLLDIPSLFLLFWLMRRLDASRMTARFLLAPLLTLLAGIALQQTLPPARACLGMALLAGGAGWLVLGPVDTMD